MFSATAAVFIGHGSPPATPNQVFGSLSLDDSIAAHRSALLAHSVHIQIRTIRPVQFVQLSGAFPSLRSLAGAGKPRARSSSPECRLGAHRVRERAGSLSSLFLRHVAPPRS